MIIWTAHWINCRGFGSLCMETVEKIHYIFFISNNLKIKIKYRVWSAVFVAGRECTIPTPFHGKAWLMDWPTFHKDTSVLGQLISKGQSRQEYKEPTVLAQQGTSLMGAWRKAPDLPGDRGEVGRELAQTLTSSQSSVLSQILPLSLLRCGSLMNTPALQTPISASVSEELSNDKDKE